MGEGFLRGARTESIDLVFPLGRRLFLPWGRDIQMLMDLEKFFKALKKLQTEVQSSDLAKWLHPRKLSCTVPLPFNDEWHPTNHFDQDPSLHVESVDAWLEVYRENLPT